MVRVKICGIMCEQDIIYLNGQLPDYAGFIFAESRRSLKPGTARDLAAGLAAGIRKVGVFVNAEPGETAETAALVGLDAVQLHGDETAEYVRQLRIRLKPGIEIWKAFRVRNREPVDAFPDFHADRILLDAYSEGSYGGAGRKFDWGLAEAFGEYRSGLILAGGLNPENVQQAIRIVKPFAVDVSSGVETDGIKDEAKIADFIQKVRKMEA